MYISAQTTYYVFSGGSRVHTSLLSNKVVGCGLWIFPRFVEFDSLGSVGSGSLGFDQIPGFLLMLEGLI